MSIMPCLQYSQDAPHTSARGFACSARSSPEDNGSSCSPGPGVGCVSHGTGITLCVEAKFYSPPPQKHSTLSRAILLFFLCPAVATDGLKLRDLVQAPAGQGSISDPCASNSSHSPARPVLQPQIPLTAAGVRH